jgi:hypothetical protein
MGELLRFWNKCHNRALMAMSIYKLPWTTESQEKRAVWGKTPISTTSSILPTHPRKMSWSLRRCVHCYSLCALLFAVRTAIRCAHCYSQCEHFFVPRHFPSIQILHYSCSSVSSCPIHWDGNQNICHRGYIDTMSNFVLAKLNKVMYPDDILLGYSF